jgi:hypothetical protein
MSLVIIGFVVRSSIGISDSTIHATMVSVSAVSIIII